MGKQLYNSVRTANEERINLAILFNLYNYLFINSPAHENYSHDQDQR